MYAWGKFCDPQNCSLDGSEENVHYKQQIIARNVKKIACCRDYIVILDNNNKVYIFYGVVKFESCKNHDDDDESKHIKEEVASNKCQFSIFESIKTVSKHFFSFG